MSRHSLFISPDHDSAIENTKHDDSEEELKKILLQQIDQNNLSFDQQSESDWMDIANEPMQVINDILVDLTNKNAASRRNSRVSPIPVTISASSHRPKSNADAKTVSVFPLFTANSKANTASISSASQITSQKTSSFEPFVPKFSPNAPNFAPLQPAEPHPFLNFPLNSNTLTSSSPYQNKNVNTTSQTNLNNLSLANRNCLPMHTHDSSTKPVINSSIIQNTKISGYRQSIRALNAADTKNLNLDISAAGTITPDPGRYQNLADISENTDHPDHREAILKTPPLETQQETKLQFIHKANSQLKNCMQTLTKLIFTEKIKFDVDTTKVKIELDFLNVIFDISKIMPEFDQEAENEKEDPAEEDQPGLNIMTEEEEDEMMDDLPEVFSRSTTPNFKNLIDSKPSRPLTPIENITPSLQNPISSDLLKLTSNNEDFASMNDFGSPEKNVEPLVENEALIGNFVEDNSENGNLSSQIIESVLDIVANGLHQTGKNNENSEMREGTENLMMQPSIESQATVDQPVRSSGRLVGSYPCQKRDCELCLPILDPLTRQKICQFPARKSVINKFGSKDEIKGI